MSEEPSENVVSRREDLVILLIRIGQSALLAIMGVAVFFFGVLVLSGEIGNIWTGLVELFGLLGCLIAIVHFGRSVWWFFRVPKFTRADQVANCFNQELLGSENGTISRAWSCLDSTARAEFNSLDDFRNHWKDRKSFMKEWALDKTTLQYENRPKGQTGTLRCDIHLTSAEITNVTEHTAELHSDIMALVYENVEAGKDMAGNSQYVVVMHGQFVWPQLKTLLLGQGRWFLTSGTLEGPKPK